MKRVLAFAVPFALVVSVGLVAMALGQRPVDSRGPAVPTAVGDVHLEEPFVRVHGTAHYAAVVKQTVPPRFPWDEAQVYYLFPLFDQNDPENRAIRLMVRTARKPERLVNYEVIDLEGRLVLPTAENLPYNTEIAIGKASDYFFTDEMLILEPWRIESEDGVWEEESY